jgi:hypothetical protein
LHAVRDTRAERGAKGFTCQDLSFPKGSIVAIYKDRRQIEIFFKAIMQNLKIKTFVGTSKNALLIQIWTALIAILLLKFLRFRSSMNWSLSNLVAMLSYNLFTYLVLWLWLDNPFEVPASKKIQFGGGRQEAGLPGFSLETNF